MVSCASPPVSTKPKPRPSAFARMWILVEKPPRERPRALRQVPPFLRRHADAPRQWWSRSSARCQEQPGSQPRPPGARPRALSASISGTGGRPRTTCPPLRADRARVSPSWQSRRSRRARGGRSAGCLPRFGPITNGSKNAHSASFSLPRIKAAALQTAALNHLAPPHAIVNTP